MERALKHKFTVGETVYFTASNVARPAASGTYEVIRLLPTDGDDCQYRIKSSTEAFERVAKESQLDDLLKELCAQAGEAVPFRPPSKGPVRGTILRKLNAVKHGIRFRRIAFYAALRDIAHELGLGYIARSNLAFADLSDVADSGRGGIFRDHRSDHAVARREIGRQRRADGDHAAGDRHRRSPPPSADSVRAAGPRPTEARIAAADQARRCRRLSCIDDLAGETVLAAARRRCSAPPKSAAAAVSYAAPGSRG